MWSNGSLHPLSHNKNDELLPLRYERKAQVCGNSEVRRQDPVDGVREVRNKCYEMLKESSLTELLTLPLPTTPKKE